MRDDPSVPTSCVGAERPPQGAEELAAFHKPIVQSLCIALGVFVSGNVNEARKLIAEKTELRNAELAAAERNFERLAADVGASDPITLAAPGTKPLAP